MRQAKMGQTRVFREVPGSDGGIIVGIATKLQKTTINLAERTRRSPRSRMMALEMRRRHQVVENGREIEGAPPWTVLVPLRPSWVPANVWRKR